MMRLLDISFRSPAENIAFDEVLLDAAETRRSGETLRFWESPKPFVVVGVSQAVRQQVDSRACEKDGIAILRRCSAGGSVLQGPGCLNYSLILAREGRSDLRTIRGSYCYILERLCEAFRNRGLSVRHTGTSDLSLRGKKISGNAQRRRRRFILHHGTILHNLDPEAMERYLREPPETERPKYRGTRTHRGFVRNVPMDPPRIQNVVCEAFDVEGPPAAPSAWERKALRSLVKEKYALHGWNYRR